VIHHPILDRLSQHGVKLGVERMASFLAHVGDPHLAYPVIHIGGTNGKGSTSMMVSSALAQAGYRVGTNLSPHLEQVNERIRLDTVPMTDSALAAALEGLDRHRQDWSRAQGDERPLLTYFEFLTALSFYVFAQEPVDVGVIEVGLGGRLDATNVVRPVVTSIVTVGMDHEAELGNSLGAIAGEKAGIFKRGVPAVVGLLPDEARDVVELRARTLQCELWRAGAHLRREWRRERWSFSTPGGNLADVSLPLRGDHMGHNAMVAVGILHRLRNLGFHLPDDAIRRGLETVDFSGRLEQLAPGLVADGAHNVDGAKALATWLSRQPRPKRRILLFGMGQGRDPVEIVAPLLAHVDEVVTTRCAHPKAREPMDLAEDLQGHTGEVPLAAGADIDTDLAQIYVEADETIVAGSLYLAGAARSLVRAGKLEGLVPGSVEPEPLDEVEGADEDDPDEVD
jgi:dihydrofolate synthase/folylpolyglutamate synthase